MPTAISEPDLVRGPSVVEYRASEFQCDVLARECRVVMETY